MPRLRHSPPAAPRPQRPRWLRPFAPRAVPAGRSASGSCSGSRPPGITCRSADPGRREQVLARNLPPASIPSGSMLCGRPGRTIHCTGISAACSPSTAMNMASTGTTSSASPWISITGGRLRASRAQLLGARAARPRSPGSRPAAGRGAGPTNSDIMVPCEKPTQGQPALVQAVAVRAARRDSRRAAAPSAGRRPASPPAGDPAG